MSDWAPGDLALCISKLPDGLPVEWEPRVGAIYIVAEYYERFGEGFLELEEDPAKFDPRGAWEPLCFIKVTPPEEMEGDELEALILSAAPLDPYWQIAGDALHRQNRGED